MFKAKTLKDVYYLPFIPCGWVKNREDGMSNLLLICLIMAEDCLSPSTNLKENAGLNLKVLGYPKSCFWSCEDSFVTQYQTSTNRL